MSEEIRARIMAVRGALERIHADRTDESYPEEAVRNLGRAVDNVRQAIWAVLTAEHAGDYPTYLGSIRMQRTIESCEDVLSDLYADTLAPHTPGLDAFQTALREVVGACDRANA